MRIGLYGLPTAGKSYILSAVRNLEVLSGSSLLKEIAPDFHDLTDAQKEGVRQELALQLRKRDKFIMDGHYSFGDAVVFTEADGQLYDTFLYLYVDPKIISERMSDSIRNTSIFNMILKSGSDSNWSPCEHIVIRTIRTFLSLTILVKASFQISV